jgi:AAA-like domain
LPEFTLEQIADLAQRHELRLSRAQVEQLMVLVGGHPYLVRVALYELARGRLSLTQFLPVAPTEEGPYADHLRRHWANLTAKQNLWQAFQQVIAAQQPVLVGGDERFQLRSMGLVRFRGNQVEPLCELYRSYFQNRLQNG